MSLVVCMYYALPIYFTHTRRTSFKSFQYKGYFCNIVNTARGSFAMSLDTQTTLRLAVSHRLEKAMKVDHRTTNPLKAEREDFIPPLVRVRLG